MPPFIYRVKVKGELSSGVVEGLSKKAKLTIEKYCDFRTIGGLEITLNHAMGYLPEPEMTHSFFEEPFIFWLPTTRCT